MLGREKYLPVIDDYSGEIHHDFIFPAPLYFPFSLKRLKFLKKYSKGLIIKKFRKILREQKKVKQVQFSYYVKYLPYLMMLHEETANLHSILSRNYNFVLDKIADDLIQGKLIKTKKELLNWSIKRIIKSYDFVKKKN